MLVLAFLIIMIVSTTNARTIENVSTNDGHSSIDGKVIKIETSTLMTSSVTFDEEADRNDTPLRLELELLRTFLKNFRLYDGNNSLFSYLKWPRFWSRRASSNTSVINDTVQMIYHRLIDFGFNSVGVEKSCRELAICNTSNFIATQMPNFVDEYGRDHLMNFPSTVFGDHKFTNAWLIGLAASDQSNCKALFSCPLADQIHLSQSLNEIKKIPIEINLNSSKYLSKPIGNSGNNNRIPFMLEVEWTKRS